MGAHEIDEFLHDFRLATFITANNIGFVEVDRRLTHRNTHHIVERVDHQRVAEQSGFDSLPATNDREG